MVYTMPTNVMLASQSLPPWMCGDVEIAELLHSALLEASAVGLTKC